MTALYLRISIVTKGSFLTKDFEREDYLTKKYSEVFFVGAVC